MLQTFHGFSAASSRILQVAIHVLTPLSQHDPAIACASGFGRRSAAPTPALIDNDTKAILTAEAEIVGLCYHKPTPWPIGAS
ncbi:hypothetical protein BAUCODRAFT_122509 [Baudoinia panamericana UAMH 10762]|uniref:Uncharacterized protein n=1 Tax=Baudoinia panamericana (strain UAMH 10762) TaxID=717646 RepID=M2NBJ6_BAUPA|nr:uncharacterized protein BAUCODRAFT_122509 [Baudoinia panamericana UAMH 10762]EMC96509.1 hypothetical protein BAUCODRAFT_122509 [Baudoinia panamericana UAMH 10762]